MPKEFSRSRRVEEQLKRVLAELIRREVKDPRVGPVTVTAVEVSKDLGHARVYVTPFAGLGDAAHVIETLQHAAGSLMGLGLNDQQALGALTRGLVEQSVMLSSLDYFWISTWMALGLVGLVARNQAFYDQYKAGTLNILEFLDFQLKPLSRHPRVQLDAWHAEFMQRKVIPMIATGTTALLQRHAGDTQVIVTATNSFVTGPIARHLGVAHLIATEPEVMGGEFTGRVSGTPSFKEGKVQRLAAWLAERGETWDSVEDSWFYSDSLNDLPLLACPPPRGG